MGRCIRLGVLAGLLALCAPEVESAAPESPGERTRRGELEERWASETDFDFGGPPVQAPRPGSILSVPDPSPERAIGVTREERPDGTRVTRTHYEDTSVWGLPGGWERYVTYEFVEIARPEEKGRQASKRLLVGDYPHFLRVDFVDEPGVGRPDRPEHTSDGRPRNGCVRFRLTGGRAAVRRQIPHPVDADHAYEIRGWVRLDRAVKPDTEAVLRVEWLDAEARRLAERPFAVSRPRGRKDAGAGWLPFEPLRINSVPAGARLMRIWCEAKGSDRNAVVCFDDVSIHTRPKIELSTGRPGNLFGARERVEMRLAAMGLEGAPGTRFRRVIEVRDLFGRLVASQARRLEAEEIVQGRFEEALAPAIDRFGIFTVEIRILRENAATSGAEARIEAQLFDRIARVPPPPKAGAFGLTVSPYAVRFDSMKDGGKALLAAIHRLGAPHAKIELWPAAGAAAAEAPEAGAPGEEILSEKERAARLAARIPIAEDRIGSLLSSLQRYRVELTGVLAPMPAILTRGVHSARGVGTGAPVAGGAAGTADVAGARPEPWQALVARTREMFGPDLAAWQIGSDSDESFTGPQAQEAVALTAKAIASGRGEPALAVPHSAAAWRGPVRGTLPRPALLWVPAGMSAAEFAAAIEAAEVPEDETLLETGPRLRWRREAMANTWVDVPMRPAPLAGGIASEEIAQLVEMARKIVTARRLGFEQVFVRLVDDRAGLLTGRFLPRASFLGYRTLADEMAAFEWIGAFHFDPRIEAHAFERRTRDDQGVESVEAIIAAWNSGADMIVRDRALGDPGLVTAVDLMGNRTPLLAAPDGSGQLRIEFGPAPVLLTGLDPALVKTHMAMQSSERQTPWLDYRRQRVEFTFRKYSEEAVTVDVRPDLKPPAAVRPRSRRVTVGEGAQSLVLPFEVRPALTQRPGPVLVPVRVKLEGRREDRIIVYLTLDWRSEFVLEPSIEYPTPDEAHIRFRLRWIPKPQRSAAAAPARAGRDEAEPEPINLTLHLDAPGQPRRRTAIRGLVPRVSRYAAHTFRVRLTDKPQVLRAGAQERGGTRFVNIDLELPAAGTGPAAAPGSVAGRATR